MEFIISLITIYVIIYLINRDIKSILSFYTIINICYCYCVYYIFKNNLVYPYIFTLSIFIIYSVFSTSLNSLIKLNHLHHIAYLFIMFIPIIITLFITIFFNLYKDLLTSFLIASINCLPICFIIALLCIQDYYYNIHKNYQSEINKSQTQYYVVSDMVQRKQLILHNLRSSLYHLIDKYDYCDNESKKKALLKCYLLSNQFINYTTSGNANFDSMITNYSMELNKKISFLKLILCHLQTVNI